MNTTPIRPARLSVDAGGVPFSAEYGDRYHPQSGALAQARHVFLEGNGLPARWRGCRRWAVLETGFGLGNNFLATWQAWRADPQRCATLDFVSVESAPLERAALAALPREAELEALAAQLVGAWPVLTCNLHRLSFEGGAVQLLLAFGDVASWLPQLSAEIDAFYLDGFAPARNPAMWEARVFKGLARLAAPGATVATWTAARAVREGLVEAGFEIELAPGQGGKRDITRGRFVPRFVPHSVPRAALAMAAASARRERAAGEPVLVVGAGLAGCAVAHALAERGRTSIVFERRGSMATEASGNAAGLFHGVVHRADGRHARFFRAAALAAAVEIRAAVAEGVPGEVGGLLRLESRAADASVLHAIAQALGLPADYARPVSRAEASALAGTDVAAPGWLFAGGGWVDPRALCAWWLRRAGASASLRTDAAVAALARNGDRWQALGSDGNVLAESATVVIAEGGAALLADIAPFPLARTRAQLSSIDASAWPAGTIPRLPITGSGYVVEGADGAVWFGAVSQPADHDPARHRVGVDGGSALRSGDHRANLVRLRALLGGATELRQPNAGRAAFRWSTADRLPLIGQVPDAVAAAALGSATDRVQRVPRLPGLFVLAALGSRGIASAALGSRLLAAAIAGAPLPMENDVCAAVDPARFLSRAARRAMPPAREADQPPLGPIVGGSVGG